MYQPSLRYPIAVSLGAIAGALCRYYFTIWVNQSFSPDLPYATFAINLSGSFVMGLFTALLLEQGLSVKPEMQLLVATGFLGSYTTFSTFELEFVNLLKRSAFWAVAYWMGSAILGAVSLYLGILAARLVR